MTKNKLNIPAFVISLADEKARKTRITELMNENKEIKTQDHAA